MPATPEAIAQAQIAASAADDKLATDIVAIDVSEHLALTDIFVIVSAPTERQIGAIVDAIEEKMREDGRKPLRREGEKQGTWILLDFGDIITHVMTAEDRMYYQLERLWKDCPDVPLEGIGGPASATDEEGWIRRTPALDGDDRPERHDVEGADAADVADSGADGAEGVWRR